MAAPALLLIFISISFTVPLTTSLSFNFTSFSPNHNNITYDRDASPVNGAIQLTRNQRDQDMTGSIGRATYYQPMRLWDRSSRKLTDFDTHFEFIISSQGRSIYGDGLAFFLGPQGSSRVPDGVTKGSSLGLKRDFQELNASDTTFFAVEFDIFSNTFDPPNEHVGIDINIMRSVANVTWLCDIPNGVTNEVWINYNSSTHNLSVAFSGVQNNARVMQHLSYVIDLRLYLDEIVTFGFSAATASIGNATAIHAINSWNFRSNLQINQTYTPNQNGGASHRKRNKKILGLKVGLGIAGALITGVIYVLVAKLCRKNASEDSDGAEMEEIMDEEFERGTGPKKFSYQELVQATEDFKEANKLGEGGFGGVYKGFIRDMNCFVAVKRVSRSSKQGIKEYASEVRIISRLRHKNLVQLIGWCHERKELLLVYEFMPKGSLDSYLFKGKSFLGWQIRYKIAKGLALGLLYLHEEWEQCVVHRDIKSSNIMLDSEFNPKLGDFGLARLVDHGKGSQTTVLAGTMGYMAPECLTIGKASRASDVYSFGIVALELACGRKPIKPRAAEDEINMVEWVWRLYGSRGILEAVDPSLHGDNLVPQEIQCLMIVGLWCAHPDEKFRPSIRQVIHALDLEATLPDLPSQMPIPTYYPPSFHHNGASSDASNTNSSSQITSSSAASSSPSASLLHNTTYNNFIMFSGY